MKPSNTFLPVITYRTSHSLMIPLIPLLSIAIVIGLLFQQIHFVVNIISQGENNYSLQTLEGILLVVLSVMGGFTIAYLIKERKAKILKVIYGFGVFISMVTLTWILGFLIRTNYFPKELWIEVVAAVGGITLGTGALFTMILEKGNQFTKNCFLLIVSLVMGTPFGLFLEMLTFVTLIVLISIFDIYSVFRGPIHKILESNGMTFESNNLQQNKARIIDIGIGDFVFYIALVTFVSKNFDIISAILSAIAIIVGVSITQIFVNKYQRFPGLPIPIFLAIVFVGIKFLIFYLISGLF
ncbi:MAG: hypothetical protein ACTSQE_08810 [Candidatus Heimdallarchaeaceae archaeon]